MQNKTKKWGLSLCLASMAFVQLFAQGIPSDTVFKNTPKTVLQHSIALNNGVGAQYDIRFRTPNKTTDFYAAINGIPAINYRYLGVQGGVLFGNWHNFSLGAGGLLMFGATDYMTNSNNEYYNKSNIIFGLPLGIRYQSPYRSVFVQANYVPMLNLVDNTSAAYPQIQIGYSFGGKNPNIKRDTTPIPQGIQHSAYVQTGIAAVGLAYDARFRTKIKWLDWAATATVGGFPKSPNSSSVLGGGLSASALFGKRAFSFEVGVRGIFTYHEGEQLSYLDYKTGDYIISEVVHTQSSIGLLLGLRYQRPKGGISGFANISAGPSRDTRATYYSNTLTSICLGLGYSLKTK
jgi:hypothetical protein